MKKIKPNPPVKAKKNWQLTAAAPVEVESFYVQMKEQMVQKCVAQGMPQDEVQEFLNNHGIAEDDIDQVEMNLRQPGY